MKAIICPRAVIHILFCLPGAPADGSDGGDVILKCDTSLDSLLHFRTKNVYTAKKGPQGNPEEGSQGPKSLSPSKRPRRRAPPCIIPVPPGTVIKRKGSGRLVGELLGAGDELTVAKGGRGGYGVVVPSKKAKPRRKQSPSKHVGPHNPFCHSRNVRLLEQSDGADDRY